MESKFRASDPKLMPEMSPYTRDHPEYWRQRPSDHSVEGLLVGGNEGDACSLGDLIPYTHCAVSASTPENERKQYVTYKGRERSGHPFYSRPLKPANSGRRKAA